MSEGHRRSRKGRADNHDGTIYQSADGRWHARVIVGESPDGRPIRKHREARTEKEIRRKFKELIRERDFRIPAEGRTRYLVSELLADYLAHLDKTKPNTRNHYDEKNWVAKRLNPAFGGKRARDLDALHIEAVYLQWFNDAERPISSSTIERINAILKGAFNFGIAKKLVIANPAIGVTIPKMRERKEQIVFSASEAQQILNAARETPMFPRWGIAISMGLRQGEVLGLRWQDINLDEGHVLIRHALSRVSVEHQCGGTCGRRFGGDCLERWSHGCGDTCGRARAADCRRRLGPESLVLGPTKSKRSHATALPGTVLLALREHKASQDVLRGLAGDDWWDLDYVFCNEFGRPIDPRRDYAAWQALLDKVDLPPAKLHAARHTCGTLMAEMGTPLTTIKAAFGHSSTKVTERYVQTPADAVRRAVDSMDAALFGTTAVAYEPARTETGTETGFGLLTFDQVIGTRSHEGNRSRLGDLNPGPTHYECVALPLS